MVGEVVVYGAGHAAHVEAGIGVEVLVLYGDGGVAQGLGDLSKWDLGAAPGQRIDELVQQLAVAVVDAAGLEGGFVTSEIELAEGVGGIRVGGEAGYERRGEGEDADHGQHEHEANSDGGAPPTGAAGGTLTAVLERGSGPTCQCG